MNANSVLVGMFVGVMTISMFTPILSIYGFNQTTSMILLYSLPFVGALSIVAVEALGIQAGQPGKVPVAKPSASKNHAIESLAGRNVTVHTRMGGSYKGMVRGCDEKIIILDKATRLDIPDRNVFDHVFIERSDIKRLESS